MRRRGFLGVVLGMLVMPAAGAVLEKRLPRFVPISFNSTKIHRLETYPLSAKEPWIGELENVEQYALPTQLWREHFRG